MNTSEIEHPKSEIHIEQIRPELTWKLRQKVLYPAMGLNEMGLEEDHHGLHFAAFKDNYIVAVVSLFPRGDDYQFRKFAVDEAVQGMGIGKQLLDYITEFTAINGGRRIWCNARVTALGFYAKSGFTPTGRVFSKNGFDYEIFEKFIDPATVRDKYAR